MDVESAGFGSRTPEQQRCWCTPCEPHSRFALVVFVSTSLVGCTSMSKLAFWRKKDDNTKLAEAPKYSGSNSQLPSSGLNPSNSLASVPGYSTNNAAAVAAAGTAAGGSSYATAPASYQSSPYPTTPYSQTKIGATASTGTSPAGWAAGTTTPTATSPYSTTSPYAATSPATSSYAATGGAGTPAYGTTASAAGGVQARPASTIQPTTAAAESLRFGRRDSWLDRQHGWIGRRIDASGRVLARLPHRRRAQQHNQFDANDRKLRHAGASVSGVPETNAATSPSTASASSVVGDRYANTMAGAGSGGASSYGSYSAGGSAYSPAASGSAYSPAASDYRSSGSGYDTGSYAGQQTATAGSLGNTGYNPPNAYSTPGYSTPTGAGATSAWPARNDQEYRPGGTSNYSAPAAQPAPSTSGAGSDSRGQLGGVTPASYTTPDTSGGRVTATMVSPVSGGSDYYGSYQGSGASSR